MFSKQYSRFKSAITLIVILAALIIPLYQIEPVSATTTSFYGGALPSNQGGIIISLDMSVTIAGAATYWINVTDGGVVVCSFLFDTPGSVPPVTIPYTITPYAGSTTTLLAGQTYNFVYQSVYGSASFSNVHLTITPTWQVNFKTSGLDSSTVTSNTVVTINGSAIPYSSFPYTTYISDGDTISFVYTSIINSTVSTKTFLYVSTNASSPSTITAPLTILGTYNPTSTSSIHHLTVRGPYFEDGSVATGNSATFNILYPNGTTYTSTLTSTGSAGSIAITSLTDIAELTWNASSASATFNSTRVYTFANGQNGIDDSTVYLYILNPSKPAYQYTFSVTDFYGMINPYLQTSVSPSGNVSTPIERFNLKDGGGFVTFVLQQYQLYGLTFICQQGTYSQTFTPNLLGTPGQNVVTLSVTAGNFPVSNTTGVTDTFANRTNSNTIYASYFDPNATTTWVYASITHLQGSTTITDYTSSNSSSSSQSWSWSLADANTNYYVTITAYAGGKIQTYKLPVSSVNGNNPWSGLDWSYIGKYIPTLPTTYTGWGGIDPTQMIAVFLILCALGIGSYFSTGASCLICWVIGGILLAMGWWQGSIPLFAFSGVITVWILIDEYKKGNFNL